MKKFIKLTLIATLAFATLYGCSDPANRDGKNKQSDANTIVKGDGSFDIGEEVIEVKPTLSPEEADFRSLKWGMTKDEVKEVEGTGYSEPKDYILYYTRVREEGYPADAEYKFTGEGLVQGEFFIFDNKDGVTVEFKDYEELVSDLKQRFGEPLADEKTFVNSADSTENEDEYINLVMQNKMIRRTKWILENKNTELRAVLHNRNGKICIGLQYKKIGAEVPKE